VALDAGTRQLDTVSELISACGLDPETAVNVGLLNGISENDKLALNIQ
jgi:hypothetical protein